MKTLQDSQENSRYMAITSEWYIMYICSKNRWLQSTKPSIEITHINITLITYPIHKKYSLALIYAILVTCR